MSELQEIVNRLAVLPLVRYCQITGENANAIHQRRHRGVWVVGRELLKPEGGDYWVDLVAVQDWVKERTGQTVAALVEGRVKEETKL